ncbi:MAG: cation diffusion facilitator family transporter [Caulobacterales bacterium]
MGGEHTHGHADHDHDDHGHGHAHHHHAPPEKWDRPYTIGIALNIGFVAIESIAGVIANSTALLADAGHNLSDVLGLALAGGAAWLAKRSGPTQRTYGYGKATILAALANGLILIFACGAIGWEAIRRLSSPPEVASTIVIGVAAIGVVINTATALLFMRGRHSDVNARGAFLHMAADAAVSAGVIIAGLIIAATGWRIVDPIVSVVIIGVILASTIGLLRQSLDLALDTAPEHVDVAAVKDLLLRKEGVSEVHDLHVWAMSTTETALTAHLVCPNGGNDGLARTASDALREKFGIGHVTLQIEREWADCPTH